MTRRKNSRGKQVAEVNEAKGLQMKKFFLATVSVLALTSASRSADLAGRAFAYAPNTVPAWTGGYWGVRGGVARHDAAFNDLACVPACGTISGSKTGGTIGTFLGYNWQYSSFVYGLEGDWSWIGAKTTATMGTFFLTDRSYNIDWVATIRGRAGLAVDATLLYVTGGVAIGHVKNSIASFDPGAPPFSSFRQDKTKVGWTAGAGVEHLFSPHWTARAEFRFVDLGTSSVVCTQGNPILCPTYRGEFSNTLLTGTVGLAYKF